MLVGPKSDMNTARVLIGARTGLAAAPSSDIQNYHNNQILVAVCGHPHLATHSTGRDINIAEQIAIAYQDQGTEVLKLLSGHFALALIDENKNEILLSVDRLGTHPIYYASTEHGLIFSPRTDAILANPLLSHKDLDPQAIFNYLYFHMVPGPNTIYQSIRGIPAGHFLHWKNGSVEINPYWTLQFHENEHHSFGTLKHKFKEVLRNAVQRSISGQCTGAFLSGGTDSSTVSGLLGEVTGKPAQTYSIGFAADGYDETEYARLTSRHFGTEHHEYSVTPDDVVSAIPAIAQMYDQPFGNASAVPTYYCAKLAKEDGIDRLLGGDGGDELFGGNTRYAKQWIFSLYSELPMSLRSLIIEPVVNHIPLGNKLPPLCKLQNYIKQASIPMPGRMESYNLLNRITPQRVFTPEFLEQIDTSCPLHLLQQTYDNANANSLINRMLATDVKFTLTDSDLPKVARMCELAHVNAGFPLLDDEVIDFSAHLSPNLKLRATHLRYFFKKALADFLPPEVLIKKKQGFGLPFGVWMEHHPKLHKIAHNSLNDLRQRGIIRTKFIDELQSELVATHPGYYGTMIWILMMLEQWFQHHHPD
ncbi:MAG: asparagine synthase [Chloroflexi bacterium]|nr:asparagine synthase [Chloroflexota bacterium]